MAGMMLSDLLPLTAVLGWRRRRLAKRAANASPLKEFLGAPLPDLNADWRDGRYLAVDFETTGLNADKDRLLSMGWVAMDGPEIDLGSAHHRLIDPQVAIPEQSAIIHCITDDQAACGIETATALRELLHALDGRVLIAHNARFEMAFLQAACKHCWGSPLALPVIDTMTLARAHFERRHLPWRQDALRLDSLRQRHHLPRYRAHHALNDALGTAELFSALVQERGETRTPIRSLLSGLW